MKHLYRDIKRNQWRFVAIIVLVAVAGGVYIGFKSPYISAYSSFITACEEPNFPDIIVITQPSQESPS